MANGLDRDETGFGFRQGLVYRNNGGPGPDGWFYYVGTETPRGPYGSKALAVSARDTHLGKAS